MKNLKYSQVSVTSVRRKFQATVQAVDRPLSPQLPPLHPSPLFVDHVFTRVPRSPCQCDSTNALNLFTDLPPATITLPIDSVVENKL